MKLSGFVLLVSGWVIVIAAVALLVQAARSAFVLAGIGVEMLGLFLVVRSHLLVKGERD